MIKSRTLNINGLRLSGDEPITPRTLTFLQQHNMNVQQQGGFLTLTGPFSIARAQVDAFLNERQQQDDAARAANQNTRP